MSRVLLLHLDGAYLALMRIAAHHRAAHADRDYRRKKLRDFGARPYPMPYTRTGALGEELKRFQKWVIQRADLFKTWEEWCAAKGELRNLGDRRVSLPLFPEGT